MAEDLATTESRRQSPRLTVDGRLQTRIATLHMDVELRDVSFGGFLVASATDISTGDVHVFEIMTRGGEVHTLRARVVHCHGPRGAEAAFLSGWRCATDETTTVGLRRIIAHLVGDNQVEIEPAAAHPARKAAAAWHLLITTVAAGQVAGHALVCPEVRYAAVRWHVAPQIDRRFGSSAMWLVIKDELADDDIDFLPAGSVTSALLLPEDLRTSCALQVHSKPAIPAAGRDALTEALDQHLWFADDEEPAPVAAAPVR